MIFEIIHVNKPFVIYLDTENHIFSEFGKKMIRELKENHLLFDNEKRFKFFLKKDDFKNFGFQRKIKIF